MHVDLVRDALHRVPFQEFTMRLADGRSLLVRHPDFVAVSKRHIIVVNAQDDSVSWIEPLLIVSIDYMETPGQAPKPQEGNGA
jgi:hypothetical protein